MEIVPRIELPEEWPGRVKIKLALVVLRVAGHWNDWLSQYAKSGSWGQKHQYPAFRDMYYEVLTGMHPDGARRVGK